MNSYYYLYQSLYINYTVKSTFNKNLYKNNKNTKNTIQNNKTKMDKIQL